jgi:hypothetical protein
MDDLIIDNSYKSKDKADRSAYFKAYREANRELYRKASRKFRANNRELCNERSRKTSLEYYYEHRAAILEKRRIKK